MKTDEDRLNLVMANRKHDEMRPRMEREQRRVNRAHFMENASVMEILGLLASEFVGQEYRPQFVRAVAACNKVGVSWYVVAKKNRFGEFFRSPEAIVMRERVWAAMRDDGMSFPEIAYCFGTGHSTLVTAMQRMERREVA